MEIDANITNKSSEQVKIRACDFLFEFPDNVADAKAVLAAISSIMSVLAALSNAVILLAIKKTPSLRKPSHILIANLALSDFLVGVFGLFVWATDGFEDESRSTKYCVSVLIKRTLMYWLAAISVFTLVVISFDRVLAVKLKASYCLVVTAKRVKLVLLVCWIISGAYVSVLGFWNNVTLKMVLRQVAVVICLLLTFIAVSYTIAAKKLRCLACQVSAANNQSKDLKARAFDALKYRKSLKTMMIVFFATILFYVPVLCISAIKSFGNLPFNALNLHFRIAEAIVLGNSMINPVIYLCRMRDLRQAVYNTLRKVLNQ